MLSVGESIKLDILNQSYWEHYKLARDIGHIYDIGHPKRIEIEKALNELLVDVNTLQEKKKS